LLGYVGSSLSMLQKWCVSTMSASMGSGSSAA